MLGCEPPLGIFLGEGMTDNECNSLTGCEAQASQAVDLSKLQAGDEVELRNGAKVNIYSISGGNYFRVVYIGCDYEFIYTKNGDGFNTGRGFDIIAIHPKPFDWADVKAGMAFVNEGQKEPHYRYVGKSTLYDDRHVFECIQWADTMRVNDEELLNLTRCPSHDIEVK